MAMETRLFGVAAILPIAHNFCEGMLDDKQYGLPACHPRVRSASRFDPGAKNSAGPVKNHSDDIELF